MRIGFDPSPELLQLITGEGAEKKRMALRGRYRAALEERLGRPMEEWYAILASFERNGAKKWFELARYLRTVHNLELWEANVVVYYYQHPEKREEIGEKLTVEVL